MCTQPKKKKKKEKNIITNSFLSNAEYEVSSFFVTFHKSKNRQVTIFSSTGMQNSTIIKEMHYVNIVCLRPTLFTFFFSFSYSHICLHIDTNQSST